MNVTVIISAVLSLAGIIIAALVARIMPRFTVRQAARKEASDIVQATFEDARSQRQELAVQAERLVTRVDKLEQLVRDARTEADDLRVQLRTMERLKDAEIAVLSGTVATLNGRVQSLTIDLDLANTKVLRLTGRVLELETKYEPRPPNGASV